jgi:hypothetical protein
MDGYAQKFDIQGIVASTKRRRTCDTPSIGRSRGNAGDRTFYDAILLKLFQISIQVETEMASEQ